MTEIKIKHNSSASKQVQYFSSRMSHPSRSCFLFYCVDVCVILHLILTRYPFLSNLVKIFISIFTYYKGRLNSVYSVVLGGLLRTRSSFLLCYQTVTDRAEEPRYVATLPRMHHSYNSQPPPKVPPRVAPKPSREKVLKAKEEKRRQENDFHVARNDMRRRSNPEIPSRPPLPSQDYTGNVRDERISFNQTMVVELDRDRETGYGFSIRGGRELNLPIFVLRMADGGAAQRDGRLRVRIVGALVKISSLY